MEAWESEYWKNYRDSRDKVQVNNPIIIEGGQCAQKPLCPPTPNNCGTSIDLDQFANYILRKFAWQQEGNGPYPPRGREEGFTFARISYAQNIALQIVGIVEEDGLYELDLALLCKTADAGATSELMTVTYMDAALGLQTLTCTLALTALASQVNSAVFAVLLANSPITVVSTLTGAYGAATYDAFVSARKCA